MQTRTPTVGQTLKGPHFNEPVRIETVQQNGPGSWTLGVVGLRTQVFRKVTLRADELDSLESFDDTPRFDGDGQLLKLGVQAYSLGIAYEFDPFFALSVSRVDPLPHQLSAVYDYLLKLARIRFLLADDAGAGKTIMAGLLLRELKLRGLAERILIVCPSNLTFQWRRELLDKFGEKFEVIKGADIREQYGVNEWMERKQLVTSLDLAKRTDILPGLQQVHWDLVIVDEAHRMSWTPPSGKTARYALGELLRDTTDHFLMLTATPHKGDPQNFSLFLQLLDKDVYADVKSVKEAISQRSAPFYLRRTKEAMVYFPERQSDDTWAARKIFTKRIPKTVGFTIEGAEDDLYRDVTRFVKRQSATAAAQSNNPRARAVGFLMSLYQRRLASSTYALRRSLEKRADRLEKLLKDADELAAQRPPDIPSEEDLEEMEDTERENIERILDAITLSLNADQVKEEIQELRAYAVQAGQVEDALCEAKLAKLRSVLENEGFFADSTQQLLIFTEFKDTLDYLVRRLNTDWGMTVGHIHGGMKPGSRDEPGTRLFTEQQFRDGAIQVLVATEAAGEGINLQCCHIMFNYDIPWNPNRLEQRMGRIHRYGQTKDCLIFNFVATNTIEGNVLTTLLEKLQEIRNALDDDAVFNVVGEVLPAAHVERALRDYYAGKLGDEDLTERLLQNVEESHFRAICQNALEGLATKNFNLEMLVERRALAQERRIVPESIARFLFDAGPYCNLTLKPAAGAAHTFEIGRIPSSLRRHDRDPDWRGAPVATRYPRSTTDRKAADDGNLEWITPGHPLFEAIRREIQDQSREPLARGACFYSLQHEIPARMDFYRAKVVDGLGDTIHERLFVVETRSEAEPQLRETATLGNLVPAPGATPEPQIFDPQADEAWLNEHALQPFLQEVRQERLNEIERIRQHVELSLNELLLKADEEIGKAQIAKEQGEQGAEGRLAQAENRYEDYRQRRNKRRQELQQQASLTLQGVERFTSIVVLPHPEREAPDVRNLRSNPEAEATAMRVATEHEIAGGRQPTDVSADNLGYDIRSVDPKSGELRLIEVKGLSAQTGNILLTPNEHRVAQDRRDCYWLYVVTACAEEPQLHTIADPAKQQWHEVTKVQHYSLAVDAMSSTSVVRESRSAYGGGGYPQ